jgi:very-short-patch-repair endonuclease
MELLSPQLAAIAREHDGIITRVHTRARHLSPAVLRAAVAAGAVHRVRPGVCVTTQRWAVASPFERYALTVRGLLLAHPTWLASHHAALAEHRLPLHDVDLGVVDVAAPVRASKIRPGLHVHAADPSHLELARRTSERAVPVAAACVLTATASGVEAAVVAMDAALHRRMTTPERLTEALSLPGARFGIGMARASVAHADPLAESPGESRTRLILLAAGLTVRSQVTITDARGDIGRVDFLVGTDVVVEFDGLVKYEGADGRQALAREKAREDRLREAGFRVVRLTWADLRDPDRVVARVRRALAAGA